MKLKQHNSTFAIKLTVAVIVAFAAMAVSCCLGSSSVTLKEVFLYITGRKDELSGKTVLILGGIRIPRVITAAIIGGNLALIGSVMQGLLKNPMADPSILGISSGSALGATVAIMTGVSGTFLGGSLTGTYVGAVIGALITWAIVFSFARLAGEFDTSSTLLAGVAVSSIMTGIITFLMTLRRETMEKIYMWMLGSLSFSTESRMWILLVVTVILATTIIILAARIDVLKLGKETAHTLGVGTNVTLGLLMFTSSVLLAFCVASSGIIGFVGLVIPHIVSFFRVYKARQKALMSFFVGAAFLVICDTISKTIVSPGEVAVGAVTSLIGAPYFLFLLIKNRRNR